ncbi:hypothetical protein tb265_43560 [Gemmatimonadetes bacterium T265]|nr:hypothetical protein tb265_43560 [Gemmatimonadetes bacterium T265]
MRTDQTSRSESHEPAVHGYVPGAPATGVRAGPYTLERELGRGGMATVYLAYDPKHDRRVAVKVLAGELTALLGAERFVQEVRVTARLQHPHILALLDSGVFGPEAGALAGRPYYVMPYVEGPSLRARLDREGALPVAEAVRLARQVAAALDHAHRHGVVHRDVKPENILLHEGDALVADFGIALAVEQAGGARMTLTGLSLGTPHYMAPEQAMGERQITARCDVYALGAVAYEMLAGEPPFTGATAQAVVARAMTEAPRSLSAQRPSVPPHVDAAVRRALEKLPGDRFASAQAFAEALEEPTAGTGVARASGNAPIAGEARGARRLDALRVRARDPVVLALAAGAAVAGAGAASWWGRGPTTPAPRAVRFVLDAPGDSAPLGTPALTPDGGSIVLKEAGDGGGLAVRALDDLWARPLVGTAGARNPFVSPDGRWVAFTTATGDLARVRLDGAAAARVVASGTPAAADGAWAPGGVIVVDAGPFGGLARIDTVDGVARPLTRPDTARGEQSHSAPRVLPDGKAVVFTVTPRAASAAAGELAVAPLDGPATEPAPHVRLGVSGRAAVGVVDGHLLYVAADGGAVMAVPFDAARRRAAGRPTAVLRDGAGTIAAAALAADGTLLYTRGPAAHAVVLADARGAVRPLVGSLGPLGATGVARGEPMHPRVSPDGRRLALQVPRPGGQYDIWVYDLASGTPTRLTTTGHVDGPEWTPDGRRVVFTATDGGRAAFWAQPADGGAPAERLGEASGFDATLTPDGRTLVYMRNLGGHWGIWSARLDGDAPGRAPRPVLTGGYDLYMPAVSPDGRWLAYVSTESGRDEVYVRPFPGPGAAVQVSDAGGVEPLWAPGGGRLFYRTGRQFVAASVATPSVTPTPGAAPVFAVTARTPLFHDGFDGNMPHANYAVMPDGQHFVLLGGSGDRRGAVVVVNWLPELRAALAGGGAAR